MHCWLFFYRSASSFSTTFGADTQSVSDVSCIYLSQTRILTKSLCTRQMLCSSAFRNEFLNFIMSDGGLTFAQISACINAHLCKTGKKPLKCLYVNLDQLKAVLASSRRKAFTVKQLQEVSAQHCTRLPFVVCCFLFLRGTLPPWWFSHLNVSPQMTRAEKIWLSLSLSQFCTSYLPIADGHKISVAKLTLSWKLILSKKKERFRLFWEGFCRY